MLELTKAIDRIQSICRQQIRCAKMMISGIDGIENVEKEK